MSTIWIATAADTDEDGSWLQADVIRFLLNHPDSHVAEWELPGPEAPTDPEMVGP